MRPPVIADDFSADGESQPNPTFLARRSGIDLVEFVEDLGEVVLFHADSGIRHRHSHFSSVRIQLQDNPTAGFVELDGVSDEIEDDLENAIPIGIDKRYGGWREQKSSAGFLRRQLTMLPGSPH